jgi:predicted aspartyl protease
MKSLYKHSVLRGFNCMILLFFLWPVCLQAQESYSFRFISAKRKVVRIPFEWHSNLIIVPVTVNNSDTMNFILDTGISMTLLTDPKAADALNLHYVRKVDITGVGQGSSLEALVAINNKINLTGIEAKGQSIVALSEDVLHLSNYVGIPIHGVFGFDIFRNFVVKIDFHQKVLTLYRPEQYEYRGKGEKIPISIEDAKPYLLAKAIWADNREVPIKVILDTGAGHALSLDMGTSEHIQLPDKIVRAQLGRGLNGIITGSLGRVEKVMIGKYELQNVITSFPDTNSIAAQIAKRVNRQGNIGCELLRRFDVVFDYSRHYIVLKPNKRSFKAAFERDMSGMELRAKGDNFRTYVIEHIEKGSPAEQAGVMPEDEIISINGQMANSLRLSEIYKMLQKKEGKEINLFLKRGTEFIFASFLLKRLI